MVAGTPLCPILRVPTKQDVKMFAATLARQLCLPEGILGLLVGHRMNSMNRDMNVFTLEALDVKPHHRVLDVGFGGGISLRLLERAAYLGQVTGVEMSNTMLAVARRTHREALRAGRMELEKGRMDDLSFPAETFDCVCTVNTVYFWPDLTAGISAAHRVLKQGGKFALAFRPAKDMRKLPFTRHGFALYDRKAINRALVEQGFVDVRLLEGQDTQLGFVCAMATR